MMENEKVIVFKDKQSREIHTFVHLEGHGARMDLKEFISLIADFYGSPMSTMTMKGHLLGLIDATDLAIHHMKKQTKEVAAENLG